MLRAPRRQRNGRGEKVCRARALSARRVLRARRFRSRADRQAQSRMATVGHGVASPASLATVTVPSCGCWKGMSFPFGFLSESGPSGRRRRQRFDGRGIQKRNRGRTVDARVERHVVVGKIHALDVFRAARVRGELGSWRRWRRQRRWRRRLVGTGDAGAVLSRLIVRTRACRHFRDAVESPERNGEVVACGVRLRT